MGKKNESSGSTHPNMRRAAKAGVGAGLVGLGATAAYYAYKSRQDTFRPRDPEKQRHAAERMVELLNHPKMIKRRNVIAEVAARVHSAHSDTAAVITPKFLREQMGPEVGRHALQDVIGHLRGRNFIETVPLGGRGRRGYTATDDLREVFTQIGDFPDLVDLADAQNRVLSTALDAAAYPEQDLDAE